MLSDEEDPEETECIKILMAYLEHNISSWKVNVTYGGSLA